ncbi:mitochondrial carrier domain-containing protein [Lobosporangium transversale]|uniref:Mitochondrial carrier domain-containing protein n=1 Tax=Lobosporangium transversale TaxID=64571 RepID=A0A1Y2GLR0_9FUNG|nr:mitochondrial carrier domain-containing protein [Lobosporangium transversale]ORZ13361.1 mitochondrial carrier domain-containing protein [Lobosporangium transversale]|eukprot:XP_021880442.1 mitochondrial carrier domain-containing protein [Lobosporangium transversale]
MVKTRLQNQKKDSLGKLQYRGGLDCFRQVVAKEGVRGLYRGIVPNLIGITPEKAIKLAVNDFSREYWAERLSVPEDKLPIKYGMLAGATAGFCQVIATNPMEIVKIQMQLAGSQKLTPNEQRPTAMSIVRSLGLRGLYRGTPATLLRDVPFSIIFFPLNSYIKLQGADEDGKTPFSVVLGAGLVAGVVGASTVTPADVIKTRLQVTRKPGEPVYRGIADCFQQIVRNEGFAALFKGVVPRSLIVAPMFAIALFVYELQQRYLGPSMSELTPLHTPTSSPVLMLNDRK